MTEQASVSLPWWPYGERERGGQRPSLSLEQIVAAALHIIDAEGIDALTMRRLGAELGSAATSLYWHVRRKDDLLDLVLDEVYRELIADFHVSPDAPWRERLAEAGRTVRRGVLRHRNAAVLLGSRVTVGPNALMAAEIMLQITRDAGFRGQRAFLAFSAVTNHAAGYAIFEARTPTSLPGGEPMSPEELAEVVRSTFRAVPAATYPNLHALANDVTAPSDDDLFEYGLARILDGLEADLAASGGSG